METRNEMNRRQFIAQTAKTAAGVGLAVAAGPAINVLGANSMINIGVLGPGSRGQHLMSQLSKIDDKQVRIVAIADIFDGSWRDKALAIAEERFEGRAPKEIAVYKHYEPLFADKNVDAVIIATPEHSHPRHLIAACKAGKDVYCEKPMLHHWKEGDEILKTAQSTNRIVQIGTQRRSLPVYKKAQELIEAGTIGKVTQVHGFWHRNFNPNQPGAAWRRTIPPDLEESKVDWKEFLGTAPSVPFSKERYCHWRCYWDYSNGIGSDLMVHQIDATIMVMKAQMPNTVVASGNIYRWDDGRTTCDTWSTIMEYPGFQFNYSSIFGNQSIDCGEKFYGTDGTIWIDGNNAQNGLKIIPEPDKIRTRDVEAVEIPNEYGGEGQADMLHIANWVECMRSRQKPNCDPQDGFYGAAAASMAVISYFEGRRVRWDAERQEVV